MFKNLDEILKMREEKINRRCQKVDLLLLNVLRTNLRARLDIKRANVKDEVYSVVGVDSAYKLHKDLLGKVDYCVVGVANKITNTAKEHVVVPIYEPEEVSFVIYEEDLFEEELLLKALGAVAEVNLLHQCLSEVQWLILDGSLFSTLLRFKMGLEVALKRGERKALFGIYKKVKEKYIYPCLKKLDVVLQSRKLIAVPKRTSSTEICQYVKQTGFWDVSEYNDYELVSVLLERGEYLDCSFFVEQERIEGIFTGLAKLGFELSGEAKKILKECQIFYVKGFDGVVHRVEFFGESTFFPVNLIYLQSLTGTSELQIIQHADSLAKFYLNQIVFPTDDVYTRLFQSYR